MVITHIFLGGNVIATRKTSYEDIIKVERLEEVVREIMREQHLQMIKELRSGKYDHLIPGLTPPPAPEAKKEGERRGERSLDEVILDYLAQELEEKR